MKIKGWGPSVHDMMLCVTRDWFQVGATNGTGLLQIVILCASYFPFVEFQVLS